MDHDNRGPWPVFAYTLGLLMIVALLVAVSGCGGSHGTPIRVDTVAIQPTTVEVYTVTDDSATVVRLDRRVPELPTPGNPQPERVEGWDTTAVTAVPPEAAVRALDSADDARGE